MEINEKKKKRSSDVVGIIERIALVIVFAFAVYLLSTNADWVQKQYRVLRLYFAADAQDLGYEVVRASIKNKSFDVLIADNEEKWEKGLSGRELISAKKGMLFIFPSTDRHGIWMKDMLFSLDIVWLDENLRVIEIMTDVSPDTFPQVFEPESRDLYVLEMRSGFVRNFEVEIGDELVIYR